jgi:hypothetical protein
VFAEQPCMLGTKEMAANYILGVSGYWALLVINALRWMRRRCIPDGTYMTLRRPSSNSIRTPWIDDRLRTDAMESKLVTIRPSFDCFDHRGVNYHAHAVWLIETTLRTTSHAFADLKSKVQVAVKLWNSSLRFHTDFSCKLACTLAPCCFGYGLEDGHRFPVPSRSVTDVNTVYIFKCAIHFWVELKAWK